MLLLPSLLGIDRLLPSHFPFRHFSSVFFPRRRRLNVCAVRLTLLSVYVYKYILAGFILKMINIPKY